MSDVLTWIDANGSELALNKLIGFEGRYMPPVSFINDVVPLQPGSRLRQVIVNDREISFPVIIWGNGAADLRNNIRKYLPFLDPTKGDGRLRISCQDGDQREIFCRYSGGMELTENKETTVFGVFQKAVLVFHAFDPFWYDTNTQILTYATGQPATFFPIFPLRLSSSTVFADTTIENQGDVETWPEWIIKGPGSNIVLTNLSTGQVLTLDTSLDIGESVTITTAQGKKAVKKNDGTNLFGSLSFDSSLWPLVSGNNSIRIEMSGATTDSSVQISYKNRYLGA